MSSLIQSYLASNIALALQNPGHCTHPTRAQDDQPPRDTRFAVEAVGDSAVLSDAALKHDLAAPPGGRPGAGAIPTPEQPRQILEASHQLILPSAPAAARAHADPRSQRFDALA
jgi:hypothetical protein